LDIWDGHGQEDVEIGRVNASAIRSLKISIKEKFHNRHDILEYTELILYSNCWASKKDSS